MRRSAMDFAAVDTHGSFGMADGLACCDIDLTLEPILVQCQLRDLGDLRRWVNPFLRISDHIGMFLHCFSLDLLCIFQFHLVVLLLAEMLDDILRP
jgi:hypothetical protein